MKRELKFRAWDYGKKSLDVKPRMSEGFELGQPIIKWNDGDIDMPQLFASSDPKRFVIMQYTGIKDRNETEIYEDDYIRVNGKVMRVLFKNGCFYTPFEKSKYRLGGWVKEEITVVGNFYENKNLLK